MCPLSFAMHLSVTHSPADHRSFCTAGVSALETKFHSLPRLNRRIPPQVSGAVGIVAADSGIPAIANAGIPTVSPTDIPPVNYIAATIGDADRAGKTGTPVVSNHIAASAATG